MRRSCFFLYVQYMQLIASDLQFRDEAARAEQIHTKLRAESAFGESWQAKKERILGDKYDINCLTSGY